MTELEERVFELELKLETLLKYFAELQREVKGSDNYYSQRAILDRLDNDVANLRKKRLSELD